MEIANFTNMPPVEILPVGTICNLVDSLDESRGVMCTIKLVEPDDEFVGIHYYYLVANDETKNTITDPRFSWPFFAMTTNTDDHLVPLSMPVD